MTLNEFFEKYNQDKQAHEQVEYKEHNFTIWIKDMQKMEYYTKNAETNIWVNNGSTSICSVGKTLTILEVKKILDNYINGCVNCSDCKKLIEIKDIAGQYFAGRYCKECWERKWRSVEEKESYN